MSEEIKWREVSREECSASDGDRRVDSATVSGVLIEKYYLPEEPKRKSLVERIEARDLAFLRSKDRYDDTKWLKYAREKAEILEAYIDERLAEIKK